MNAINVPAPIADAVRTRYDVISFVPVAPGMSGASVFQCESRSGERFALKRWPNETDRARAEEIHRVLAASRHHGLHLVPQMFAIIGDETIVSAGGLWEFSQWVRGTPIGQERLLDQAASGAAAIARFHDSVGHLGRSSGTPHAALARLRRVRELNAVLPAAIATDAFASVPPRLAETLRRAQIVLSQKWRGAAEEISRWMNLYAERSVTTQYVLRDVHRSHILFDGDQVTGLIDFDAIRIDSPATDIARWAGSLMVPGDFGQIPYAKNDAEELWDAVLAGFVAGTSSSQGTDGDELVRFAKHLHFATTWVSLANWVVWLLVERRTFPAGEDAINKRILEWTNLSGRET